MKLGGIPLLREDIRPQKLEDIRLLELGDIRLQKLEGILPQKKEDIRPQMLEGILLQKREGIRPQKLEGIQFRTEQVDRNFLQWLEDKLAHQGLRDNQQ